MRLGLALLAVGALTVACKMDNPAYGTETDGAGGSDGTVTSDTTGSTGTSHGSATTSTTATASDSGGTDSGGSATTGQTAPTASGTVTDGSTSGVTAGTTGVGSTGGLACELVEGEAAWFEVSQQGTVIKTCGGNAIGTAGPIEVIDGNTFVIRDCDGGCAFDCPGQEYLLEYFGPANWAPNMPPCGEVIVDQYNELGNNECAFSGIAISAIDNVNPTDPSLVYTSGHKVIAAAGGTMLDVKPEKLPEPSCECPIQGCCVMSPGAYDLSFPDAEGGLKLAEGAYASGKYFPIYGDGLFDVVNLRSHMHDVCDDFPHTDWILRRQQ